MRGLERCRDLGVEASLVACLMKGNSGQMGKLAQLAVKLGVSLRINVYKSVFTREYQPDYNEFWGAIKDMAQAAYFCACSEPVVSAAVNNRKQKSGNPCGQMSFRVHPDGNIVPCVYLRDSDINIDDTVDDFSKQKRMLTERVNLPLPEVCGECSQVDICNGGCAARRLLGDPNDPDEYCYFIRGDNPDIPVRWKESKGLVHEDYLCTMILSG
ncbi:hypothetical protein CEE37_09355 [candidate division LCP-89 bacterium B3_LCP]|uniref:4Fe4S-binding SPASM domain-containing protein n=1 Tax=candidate division LCP-89 bacterium B3_LCP TaxID=2012998 RepID=A0A532UZH3_UNCL8|nr:MAG: hypothetical protein CEE37_09355 [candidate division LCP-89 bacterium B3_LCP]